MAVEFFYVHSKEKPHLYKSWCKKCSKDYAVQARKKNPLTAEQKRKHRIKTGYGLSWNDYQLLMSEQNGCCAICKVEFDMSYKEHGRNGHNKPHVDHCHASNEVRGILCGACNKGLGFFKDKVDNLKSAINYLK